jgi:hypothetical protein
VNIVIPHPIYGVLAHGDVSVILALNRSSPYRLSELLGSSHKRKTTFEVIVLSILASDSVKNNLAALLAYGTGMLDSDRVTKKKAASGRI